LINYIQFFEFDKYANRNLMKKGKNMTETKSNNTWHGIPRQEINRHHKKPM